MKRLFTHPIASVRLRTSAGRALGLLMLIALLLAAAGCSADQVAGGMEEPREDTQPPSVSIINPVANAELKGEFALQASVSDDGEIAKVEFYADGALIGTSTAAPWTFAWNTVSPGDGPATLQAKAYDMADNQGLSPTVPVMIKNGLALTFVNTTPTSLTIAPAGQGQRVVGAGKSTTFRYGSNPGSVSYRANTKGKHGLMLYWDKKVTTSGRAERSVSVSVGSGYFYLKGRNSSDRETSSLYVNYQASNEKKVKPFSLGSGTTGIGYFKGSGATRIRIYAKALIPGTVYWDFASDITNRSSTFVLRNAAGKRSADGGETSLGVTFEASHPPVRTEELVHEPDSAEEIEG